MASIDKIYGTKEQHDEFKAWCKEYFPEALNYFYDWYDEWNDGEEHPMTNFPEFIDRWLYKRCNLPYIVERIVDQYGDDVKLW